MHNYATIQVPRPAAGADWSFTPANNAHVKLLSIVATLVTSAAVSNRGPALVTKTNNGDTIAIDLNKSSQAASSTAVYGFRSDAPSYGSDSAGPNVQTSCPGFWLPPGAVVASSTANIQAADQWSAIVATYLVCDDYGHIRLEEHLRQLFGQD